MSSYIVRRFSVCLSGLCALAIMSCSPSDSSSNSTSEDLAPDQDAGVEVSDTDVNTVNVDITQVDQAWQAQDDIVSCNVDDLVPVHVYVRRVKNLLTGLAVTNEELQLVQANPEALAALITDWVETPEFEEKFYDFLEITLQQVPISNMQMGSQLSLSVVASFTPPTRIMNTVQESFVRTVHEIVKRNEPFNTIATTQTWRMNTVVMSYLIALESYEQSNTDIVTFYKAPLTREGVNFDANTDVAVQIQHRTFYAPALGTVTDNEDCATTDPYDYQFRRRGGSWAMVFKNLHGQNGNRFCPVGVDLFTQQDSNDWRDVQIVPIDANNPGFAYYDAPSLRASNVLPLRIPRTGFFSSPAFLSAWETNIDNSYRVTTQQMLIAGLGLAFEEQDATTPLSDDGLSANHAEPGTDCYACHKNLDPMRNFFEQEFGHPYGQVLAQSEREPLNASFSFQGYTQEGEGLNVLGQHIASHPYFAAGWAQKLCYMANSAECDATDPEFQRVVESFEASNFNIKVLLRDLFSSPLITGAECSDSHTREGLTASIVRQQHLCATLTRRLGIGTVCTNNNNQVGTLVSTIPTDSWSRGNTAPTQPTVPTLFYAATLNTLCQKVALNVVNASGSPLQSSRMEDSMEFIMSSLLGIPSADPRSEPIRALLDRVLQDTADAGEPDDEQLRTVFAVACDSPYMTSVDF